MDDDSQDWSCNTGTVVVNLGSVLAQSRDLSRLSCFLLTTYWGMEEVGNPSDHPHLTTLVFGSFFGCHHRDASSHTLHTVQPTQALASVLPENKGLAHFGLHRCRWDGHCWSELIAAISTHPTLRTLNLQDVVFCSKGLECTGNS
jgi:hypothetical protein